jgi:GNAT superfamily N-acetyltransferase
LSSMRWLHLAGPQHNLNMQLQQSPGFQALELRPGVTLRIATPEDIDFAERVTAENMRDFYIRRGSAWDCQRYKTTFADFENFILCVEDAPAGVMRLQCNPGELWVRGLEVTEKYWNRGLGTACVLAAVSWAKDFGQSRVCVKVFADNRAIHLYETLGFVQERSDGNLTWLRLSLDTH